jgi:hypothetical protein
MNSLLLRRRALLGIQNTQPPDPEITLGYAAGMAMLLDGVENTLSGHNPNITTWTDLTKNENNIILPTGKNVVGNNFVEFAPTNNSDAALEILGGLKDKNNNIFSDLDTATLEMRFTIKSNLATDYGSPLHLWNSNAGAEFDLHTYGGYLRAEHGNNYKSVTNNVFNRVLTVTYIYRKHDDSIHFYLNGIICLNWVNVPIGFRQLFAGKLSFGNWLAPSNRVATNAKYFNIRFYPKELTSQEIYYNYNNDINRNLI